MRSLQPLMLIAACGQHPPPDRPARDTSRVATVTGQAMGGELHIYIRCPVRHAECLKAGVHARASIDRREDIATDWRSDSPIGAINSHPGQWQPLPAELGALLQTALSVAEASDGAFDPTIGALWGLWDFKNAKIPQPDELTAALKVVDWRAVELQSNHARVTTPGAAITLGGIAQGWAAEAALSEIPDDWDAVIDVSGDVAARGLWPVSIQHPRAPRGTTFATVWLSDGVLVTSGDYEQVFERDGRRYHHVLDPRTGYPSTAARSATVVHADGATADALATALLVVGPDADLVQKLHAWALVVDSDGEVHEIGTRAPMVQKVER